MNPQLAGALQDPNMRAMLTNPAFLRQMADPNVMQVHPLHTYINIYYSIKGLFRLL